MASLRTWRTATATLLLVMMATTSTTAAASTRTPGYQRAHYCKQVDAYRIKTCAEALLPASPLGRQLAWVLAQLAGALLLAGYALALAVAGTRLVVRRDIT